MINHGRFNLLGIQINAVDYESAVSEIVSAAQQRKPLGVSALAVHGVMTGVMDPTHRHRLNSLELVVPDGQPVRWGLNLLYSIGLRDRVYGPNLMLQTCRSAAQNNIPIYLFGGTAELLDELSNQLQLRFPDLNISGKTPSKFRKLTHSEKQDLIHDIHQSRAGITLVGIGCPRQEVWTYEFKNDLNMPVLAVGAAFNFHAGQLAQAPAWMQRWGLEWLFRLSREPKRLLARYLILNPYYLFLLAMQRLGIKTFEADTTLPPTKEILYG